MEALFQLLIVASLLALGWIAGGITERRHLRSLAEREEDFHGVLVTDLRSFPGAHRGFAPPRLLVAEVVIACDYLKAFVATIRQLIGGEIRIYRSLMERGRREAVLRLVEQAHAGGYNALANVRIVTADIGGNSERRGLPMVGVIAYATAYHTTPRPPRF